MTTTPTAATAITSQVQKRRLRAHFGFSKMPFSKFTWAAHMFDSQSQRQLLDGLILWTDMAGIALVTGPSGVGKSITLRRFIQSLEESRCAIFDFSYLPCTVMGFLRSLSRLLGLPMRQHTADLFDQAQAFLMGFAKERGRHPIVIIDDAEDITMPVLDIIRRLTCYELDAEDRFSILLSGTDHLITTLRNPAVASLGSRITYAHTLRPFALEDTRNYIHYHLTKAEVDHKLISDEAIRRVFQAALGRPRSINQLVTQALIEAAVLGRETIDGDFMAKQIAEHPLYQLPTNAE